MTPAPRSLTDPLETEALGPLKNRIVMSAMTRSFADKNHCATEPMKQYYLRRAQNDAGLILTEGIIIHGSADGYNDVPHIETEAQAESWRPIVNAVQAEGTKIFCQLWHCGRISHPDYTGGQPPLSSTNRAASGINRQNGKPFGTPVALTRPGIETVFDQYMEAARRALHVGFDGVQLHLGHGYLADQFFDARINDRTDEYGGSVENRCRFGLELVERVLGEFPARKVMVRLSPSRDMGGIYDWPDLEPMLDHLIPSLWRLGLRTLDVSCARADYYQTSGRCLRHIRPMWPGLLMGGASLSLDQATDEISSGILDLVTWGRFFIANPDLPRLIKTGSPWVPFSQEMVSKLI